MTISVAIILTLLAIVLSGLFSGTEIAFVQSSKVRVEIDATRGGIVDKIIRGFSRHEDMFISTLLVGNNIVLVIYGITFSFLINPILDEWFHNDALVLICNTLLSTLLILFTGEFLPKATFRINPNAAIRLIALPIYLIYLVLYPISWLISMISKGLLKLFGMESTSHTSSLLTIDQLDRYIRQTIDRQDGAPQIENEVKIFQNAIDFKDTQIGECMIPRNEITAVNIKTTTREQLIRTFTATGLSKIVVYSEEIDNVLGYIHVSELFNTEADWRSRIKPVIFTPETMNANKMMRRMMAEKRTLAIVVDEFGGTAGLATLEDLVEEIFGEIEDEHDRKKTLMKRLPDGSFEISGRAEIEAVNDMFNLHIKESDQYHTIAGYILENTGALPAQGDSFDIAGFRFTILRMSETRIELVKLQVIENQ